MKKFTTTELLIRVPLAIIGVFLLVKFFLNGQLVDALTFCIGAMTWEFILFFLVRGGVVKLDKYWNHKDESEEADS